MNITELVSVVSSGCKVDEIKEISALGVDVSDAIKLSKAGLSVDDIKKIVSTDDTETKKREESTETPKEKETETPKDDEKDKEIAKLKEELEKAQKANVNKDVKLGESPDPLKIAMEAVSNF